MKIYKNTIIIIPSETLNTMVFRNIATTVAYLQNLKNTLGEDTKTDIQKTV